MPRSLPDQMTVIEITEPGGPGVLVPATRAVPVPAPGEVLIKVAAAGVNRPDVMQREGHYAPPPGTTDIPGLEVAGTIAATGDEERAVGALAELLDSETQPNADQLTQLLRASAGLDTPELRARLLAMAL